MLRWFKTLLIGGIITTLMTGCSSVISNVSVFHKLPKTDVKEVTYYSFMDLENQKNSLEHETYKDKLKKHLKLKNFIEKDNSNLIISIQYGIDDGKEELYSVPIFGQTGVSSSHITGTVTSYGGGYGSFSGTTSYTPTYGITGSSTGSGSVYKRMLNMYIYDKSQNIVVYEGKVLSKGSSGQLLPVIDEMMESLFQEFPGESGKSRTVEVSFTE